MAGQILKRALTEDDVRALALSLPGVVEEPHWSRPSYRVRGRIIATVPDSGRLHVMIEPFDVEGFLRDEAAGCAELWWGKQLRGIQVRLADAAPQVVEALLASAWAWRAPTGAAKSAGGSRK